MADHPKVLGQTYRHADVAATRRMLRQSIQEGEVPRFLRAVQKVKGSSKKMYHFVEWHSGDTRELMKPTSYTQLCVYQDLGEVRAKCEYEIEQIDWKWRLSTLSSILADRNRCSMNFRQMANSVSSHCGTGCRHPHCHFA